MVKKQGRIGEHLYFFFVCIIITPILTCGCSYFNKGFQAESAFKEANDFFQPGNYKASLSKYEQIIEKYPKVGDRVLFEMGIIYAYPRNEQKDYQKSLECFQKLIKDYPGSGYRKDSEMMIFHTNNVTIKDKTIAAQQTQIEALRQTQIETLQQKDKTIAGQQTQIETLQQEVKSKGMRLLHCKKRLKCSNKRFF